MALTGFIGFGFVVMHMLGNLQIYLGPEKLDAYALTLRSTGIILYIARITLLGAVLVHIFTAAQLTKMSMDSRPVKYHKWTPSVSYASRTMRWGGVILLLFIIWHLLDFTFGKVNPDFQEGKVGHNVLASFHNPLIAGFYIVAMIALGFHMYHGVWSMFQSLGANNSKYNALLKDFAATVASLVVIGNISIPIAVLAGLIKG